MRFFRTIASTPIYFSLCPSERFVSRRFFLNFPVSVKMVHLGNGAGCSGAGRGSLHASNFSSGSIPVVNIKPNEACSSQMHSNHHPMSSRGLVSEQSESIPVVDSSYDEQFPPLGAIGKSGSKAKKREPCVDLMSMEKTQIVSSPPLSNSTMENFTGQFDGSSLPSQFGKKIMPTNATASVSSDSKNKPVNKRKMRVDLRTEKPYNVGSSQCESLTIQNSASQRYDCSPPSQSRNGQQWRPKNNKSTNDNMDAKNSYSPNSLNKPFDICLPQNKKSSLSKSSLQFEDDGARNETENSVKGDTNRILRPGMVLLKNYLTSSEQVGIVKNCQKLGLGPGGFYQPGYKDGAKLRLQMMCLGLDWDPQTRKYQDQRSVDGCEPPKIPHNFVNLVKRAIQDAHELIIKDSGVNNVENILPAMSPDICIVNFYATTGRLGLHQDRDESRGSLGKGLPVVSFSIGDSAEFLYGDERDINKAEEVILDSGDVVIFGGESRHIFHGVPCIIRNSAPEDLIRDAKLRPGRLNLTFRKF